MLDPEFNLIKVESTSNNSDDVKQRFADKLLSSISWEFRRETPKKLALAQLTEEIANSRLSPLEKAAYTQHSKKILKEYCNQNDIIKNALASLSQSAHPEDIDDEFLSRFMDNAKHVSDEKIKLIWGKLLSNECESPGRTPKSLIRALAELDSSQAEAFRELSNYVVTIYNGATDEDPGYYPIVPSEHISTGGIKFWDAPLITFDSLCELVALGLIKLQGITSISSSITQETAIIKYFDHSHSIPGPINLEVGCVSFTRAGEALYRATSPEKNLEFWKILIEKYWKDHISEIISPIE